MLRYRRFISAYNLRTIKFFTRSISVKLVAALCVALLCAAIDQTA
jgi:hypothetical protein